MTAVIDITQVTDSATVADFSEWSYDEPHLDVSQIPRIQFTVPDESGVAAYKLANGKEVLLKRNGESQFPGLVTQTTPRRGGGRHSEVTVRGVHKGYHYLRRNGCYSYDFDEDGDPSTTRDGVTVNPWQYFILREPDSALDVYGNPLPVDGAPVEDVVRALFGTRLVYQHDFQDNSHLLASQVYASTNKLQVFRDGPSGDLRPALQRTRKDGDGFTGVTTEKVESIPITNGSAFIRKMGDISEVEVVLVGERNGTDDPTIEVCRDAGDVTTDTTKLQNESSRTYTSVSLTHTANYNGSSLSAWTGSVDISADGATEKSFLGYRISIPGSDGSASTTKVMYARLTATTVSDLDLTEGTVETYNNPTIDGLRGGEENWMVGDYLGMRRHEALERLRQATESDAANNASPHWDIWIDGDLQYHFEERRGADIAKTYSFNNENLLSIEHEYFGEEVAYQTVAYGAGAGIAQNRIVNKSEFSAGGLYDSDRDPTTGSATSDLAPIARVMPFVDSNESSAVALLRKARAFHKLHREPQETYSMKLRSEHIRFFSTGDAITVLDIPTRSNAALRAVSLTRSGSGNSEDALKVEFGEPHDPFSSSAVSQAANSETLTVRPPQSDAVTGVAGNGIYFDKDHYGVYTFGVTDGSKIDRVLLKMTTQPWQATARGTNVSGLAAAGGAIGTFNADFNDKSLSTNAKNVNYSDTENAGGQTTNDDTDDIDVPTTTPLFYSASGVDNIGAGSSQTYTDTTTPLSQTVADHEGFAFDLLALSGTADATFHFDVEVRDQNNVWSTTGNVEIYETNLDSGDQIIHRWYLPSQLFRALGVSSITGARVTASNRGGATKNMTTQLTVRAVARHKHPLSAMTTNTKNVTFSDTNDVGNQAGSLTAASITALLNNLEIGYTAASGGTGTIAFSRGGTDYYEQHEHSVSGSVDLTFGIYQFGGDSDSTGDLAPLYGSGVRFGVDVTTAANGTPNDFANERVPTTFGTNNNLQTIEVDVTGYLAVDPTSGTIANGEHRVHFLGAAATDNADGLSVVSVTPIIKLKPGAAQ